MAKIQFLGRVLPEFIKVTMPPRDIEWTEDDTNAKSRMRLRIFDSIINVECESDIYSKDNPQSLYIRAFDLARASANLVAFARGEGLSIILDTVIYDEGMPLPISPLNMSVIPSCVAYQVNSPDQSVLNQVYDIVLSDPWLALALNDLISALALPHVSAVVCGRAMDGIKHLIATAGSSASRAWRQMRDALQIDEAYLKFITDTSAGPRHARPIVVPGDIQKEVIRRSWIIMDRYLEYRKRGAQPLPLSEFPLLADPASQ